MDLADFPFNPIIVNVFTDTFKFLDCYAKPVYSDMKTTNLWGKEAVFCAGLVFKKTLNHGIISSREERIIRIRFISDQFFPLKRQSHPFRKDVKPLAVIIF